MNKEASNLLAKLVTEIYKNEQLEKKVKYWIDIYTELKKHVEKSMESSVKDSNTYKAYKNIIDKIKELEGDYYE